MSQLPKNAASRMRGSQKIGGHPSADTLAAFSEQTLRPAERELMLQHLAFCTECREVVYLALPAEVETTPTLASGSFFPRLGLWRWAGVTVSAVVIVGAMLVMRPVERVQRSEAELASTTQVIDGYAGTQEAAVPAKAAAEDKQTRTPATVIAQSRRKDRVIASTASATDAGVLSRQPRRFVGQYALGGTIRRAPPALADRQASMGMNAFNFTSAPSPAPPATELALNRPSQEITYQFDGSGPAAQVDRAEAVSIEGDASALSAVSADSSAITPLELNAPLAAHEEFSLGKAKEGRAMFGSRRALEAVRNGIENLFRVAEGRVQYVPLKQRENAWRDLQISGAESLRVLAFRGREIWVAGEKGSLYRSRDDGKSWERVSTGISGDASIMFLAFRDSENGEITTSSGEKWTTTDGGHSWKKRD